MSFGGAVTVYEFPSFGSGAAPSGLSGLVDSSRFTWNVVSLPFTYPMSVAVNTAVGKAVDLIGRTPGRFILVGTGIGAVVASNVYDQLRSGVLQSRNGELVLGVVFMNPRRQSGHSFPGCTDPGGAGILQPNLVSCEDRWWDFPLANDPASCWPNDGSQLGTWGRDLFGSFMSTYTGSLYEVLNRWITPQIQLSTLASAMNSILAGTTSDHQTPATYAPISGDVRTCVQVAADRINGLVVADGNAEIECVAIPVSATGVTHTSCRSVDYRSTSYAAATVWPPNQFRDIFWRKIDDFPPPWWPKFNARSSVRKK